MHSSWWIGQHRSIYKRKASLSSNRREYTNLFQEVQAVMNISAAVDI